MPSARAWRAVASEVGTPTTFKPFAHLGADQIDEMAGGRAGAEAEPHARLHEADRPFRRLPLVGLAVRQIPHSAAGVARPAAMA